MAERTRCLAGINAGHGPNLCRSTSALHHRVSVFISANGDDEMSAGQSRDGIAKVRKGLRHSGSVGRRYMERLEVKLRLSPSLDVAVVHQALRTCMHVGVSDGGSMRSLLPG